MKKQKTINLELLANNQTLIFIYQTYKGWGKGYSVSEAKKNYQKLHRAAKKSDDPSISFFLVKPNKSKQDAWNDIQCCDFTITYETDNVILLTQTKE